MSHGTAVWLSYLSAPGAGAFALLFGLNAFSRALLTVALPVQSLEIVGSDAGVSALFLVGSVTSLTFAFLVPQLAHWMGRARLCSLAIFLLVIAMGLFLGGELTTQVLGFILRAGGTAIFHAALNMFIMDHIPRQELGRSEPLRMLSIGIAWTLGPLIGVEVEALWGPWAPFLASGTVGLVSLAYFWALRFSNLAIVGKGVRTRIANPFANLAAFLAQPRLVLAWLHAMGRGIFWTSFTIYTPLYGVHTGIGAGTGGVLVAIGSGFMLLMPIWGWAARRFGIRRVSLIAFPFAAVSLLAVAPLSGSWPWLGAACIVAGALAMTVVDGYGNALFFRACKPSQRTSMTPIFTTQRDLGELTQAGAFTLLLSFFPVTVVYVTLGLIMIGLAVLVTRVNPRL